MSACYDKPTWTLMALLGVLPDLPTHLLRVAPTYVGEGRPITGALRERIMLAVAAENRCWYCQTAHATFGHAQGVSADEVRGILAGKEEELTLPAGERSALAYVRDLARRQFQSRNNTLFDALLAHFTEAERAAIESTAHIMNLANRFGNTFDAARARAMGDCIEVEAGALDQAIISAMFVPAALAVTPLVGVVAALNLFRR